MVYSFLYSKAKGMHVNMNEVLKVENLKVDIHTQFGDIKAVRGISFKLNKKETLAIVGESGSGKSISVKSIMQILPNNGRISNGTIIFEGQDISKYSDRKMQTIRGSSISMIFQDPMTSLNPTMTIGKQINEVLKKHTNMTKTEIKARAIEILELVGISSPEKRYKQYPHQLSGGMRQRVIIAIALACNPKVLIADEPTTALDVTIQAQILDLMKSLIDKIDTSIILITHNLGVVANIADRVAVMYGGKLVETAAVDELFENPKHPYTIGLLASIPKLDEENQELCSIPGTPPDLMLPPKGCPFAARCKYTLEVCKERMPEYYEISNDHLSACWLLDERAKHISIES